MANQSKYFKNSKKWEESDINFLGLPRPFYEISKEDFKNLKFKIPRRIPVPWQSKPMFNDIKDGFELITENENIVLKKSLCGYCGIVISDNEYVSRWKEVVDLTGGRVDSDNHPFHLECMKQARIFCPYMKKRDEVEFEYGLFVDLKKNIKKIPKVLFIKKI